MLNIALPKGRLGDRVYNLLAGMGYDCPAYYDQNRKLVFESSDKKENNLTVIDEFMQISARFIANKASFKFQNDIICEMMQKLECAVQQEGGR